MVINLREYPRLPGYFTPDTIRDRDLLRAAGWKGSTLIKDCEIDTLLTVVSREGYWLSTPIKDDREEFWADFWKKDAVLGL